MISIADLISADEVARRLGSSRARVHRWVRFGIAVKAGGGVPERIKLTCVQLPSRVMFRPSDVEAFVARLSAVRNGAGRGVEDTGIGGPRPVARPGVPRCGPELVGSYPPPRRRRHIVVYGVGRVDVVHESSAIGVEREPGVPGRTS